MIMKIISHLLTALCLLFLACSAWSQDETRVDTSFESIIWKGIPLDLHLNAGTESILRFPERVQVGLPPDMVGMFEVESVSNTVYITPLSDFNETRIRFRLVDSNNVLLFDVRASETGQTVLLDVVDGIQLQGQHSNAQSTTPSSPIAEERYDYVDLIRYAFQNIYSPERLIKPLQGVVERQLADNSIVKHIVSGHDINAKPVSQWVTNDGLFVTAVYLQNLDGHSVRLDPRRFRHSKFWLATSLYSNVLSPNLQVGDVTTMVVVSDTKWEDSVSWLRQ